MPRADRLVMSWAAKAAAAAVDAGAGGGQALAWCGRGLWAAEGLEACWLTLGRKAGDARRRRLLVHETKAKGGCSVAILTGISSSRTRVIQFTFGCKAWVTGFRLRHPVLAGT